MAAVETTCDPAGVKNDALIDLLRAKRAAAWWRVATLNARMCDYEHMIDDADLVLDDALGVEELRKEFGHRKRGASECMGFCRDEMRKAFTAFREFDADVLAEGGVPAEADFDLAEDKRGWPAEIHDAIERAFPEASSPDGDRHSNAAEVA